MTLALQLWQWPLVMRTPTTHAGGIFLFLSPIIGALYGIGRGDPIKWMLIAFGIGVVLAIAVWLIDRRRH